MGEIAPKYVRGQGLISREEAVKLSVHTHNLHEWYLGITSSTRTKDFFHAAVKKKHHFKEYSIAIQFDELFQLYNIRDLNKSILGVYCL